MKIKATLTEGQRKTLFNVVAETQDGKMKTPPNLDEYPLDQFLRQHIEQANEPHDVYNACQYAIDELNRAAFAASAYGDKLDEEVSK